MAIIKVLCTRCSNTFDFNHPSVKSSKDMTKISITCPHCREGIVMAENFIVMESIRARVLRRGKATHDDIEALARKQHFPHTTQKLPHQPTIEPKTTRPVAHLPSSPLYGNPQLEAYKKALEQENNND